METTAQQVTVTSAPVSVTTGQPSGVACTTTTVGTSGVSSPWVSTYVPGSLSVGATPTFGASTSPPVTQTAPSSNFSAYPLGVLAASFESFNGREPKRYFDKVELRARLDNLSQANTLDLVKLKLTGDAYDFYLSDPSLDTLSYAEFKNKIFARFVKVEPPGSHHLSLMKIYQKHDEGVAEFVTRLRVVGSKALREDLKSASPLEVPGLKRKNDDLILNQFKVGLRRELFKEVGVLLLREAGLTLEKAEEIVKLQETTSQMLNLRRGAQVENIQGRCYICGENNHLARGCLQRQPSDGSPRTSNCYFCGREGHFARECPNKRQGEGRFPPGNSDTWRSYAPQAAGKSQGNSRQRSPGAATGAIPRSGPIDSRSAQRPGQMPSRDRTGPSYENSNGNRPAGPANNRQEFAARRNQEASRPNNNSLN